MNRLLNSAKFWVMIVDIVVSLIAYFVGKYAGASVADDVMVLIGSLQPVFVAVIVGIFVEDAAAKRNLGATNLQVQSDERIQMAKQEQDAQFWQSRVADGLGEDLWDEEYVAGPKFPLGSRDDDVVGALAVLRREVSGEAVGVLDELQAHLTERLCTEPAQ